jgi:hypothetical protein
MSEESKSKGGMTEEQKVIVREIAKQAKELGIDVRFAVALANLESSFRHIPASDKTSTAFGPFQVNQATAKANNVDYEEMKKDPNLAIRTGLLNIVRHVNNPNLRTFNPETNQTEIDPMRIAAAHRYGENSEYAKSGDPKGIDPTLRDYLVDVTKHFPESTLPQTIYGKSEETEEPSGESGATLEPKGTSEIPGMSETNKPFLGIVGAGAGTGVAGSIETGKRFLPLIPNLINKVTGQAVDVNKPVSRIALQNWLNSMLQSNGQNVKLPVSELEKLTGKKIRTMGELGEAYKDIQEIKEQKVTKPMVKMVEGRPGVFEQTGRMTTSTIPGRAPVDLSPYEVKSTGPIRQAIGNQLLTTGEVARSALPSVGRVGIGALGGANAVMTGYDAVELARKIEEDKKKGIKNETYLGLTPDEWRLASKSAATIGGGLSVLPFGLTQVAGIGLQAPEMIWSGAEYFSKAKKNANKEQMDRSPSNVDLMGNPIGGLP